MSKRLLILMCSIFLVVPLLFMGCTGDDGATGATGATGPPGPPGPTGQDLLSAPQPESCDVCHGQGKIRDVTMVHAITWVPLVSNVTTALQADNTVLISFRVVTTTTHDSSTVPFAAVPDNATTGAVSGYVNIDNAALPDVPLEVTKFQRISVTGTLAAAATAGNYTISVPANRVFDNATYVFRLNGASGPFFTDFAGRQTQVRPVVVADYNGRHLRDLVTSGTAANPTGCAACHGPYPAYSKNFTHYAVGGANCQACHSSRSGGLGTTNRTTEARTLLDNGTVQAVTTGVGANITEYVHGIHNSHNMPGETYFRSTPAAGETVEDLTTEDKYSVGYPSDMRNCIVCHASDAQQATIAAAPVSYYLCMTCHQNWDGFVRAETGIPVFGPANFHRGSTPATDCMGCHATISTIDEVSDFHNQFESADAHLDSFFRGEDISFSNKDNVLFSLTGITKAGDNVTFTWTATKLGAAVNPCNDNLANGPTFRSLGAYLAYAKGDDWVNDNVSATQAPGQPLGARNLFTSLSTTCASNVATTTGLVVAQGPKAYAQKALLAIGGKPLNRGTFLIGSTSVPRDYFVRVPSPTRAFSMTDGSAVAARRSAVDTNKCNRCHRGTLYQHGGDRVDNEQLCVICHNPSASEKNVRADRGSGGYAILNPDNTVNTSKTYDGKTAETYDMRYLLHAVHGAEKRQKPITIYRGRGIFAFAPPLYDIVQLPNGSFERFSVEHPRPTGWPANETIAQPVFGSLENDNQVHTWTTIHYPKPFNECMACHTGNEYFDPVDQEKAVAVTVDPGTSWTSQKDDLVIGPTAAACTACHESTGPAGIPVQRHATIDFGYKAVVAKEVMLQKASAIVLGPDITP